MTHFSRIIFSLFTVCIFASVAEAQTYSTQLHPTSSEVTLEMFLGDPNDGGAVLAAFENVPLMGTVQATTVLDGTNTGTLQFQGAMLSLDDIVGTVVLLDFLGQVTLDFTDSNISIQSTAIPVVNGVYSVDDADMFEVAVDGGVASLSEPMGLIDDLYGYLFPVELDFGAEPVVTDLDNIAGFGVGGTTDLGTGLFTDSGEINLDIPETLFDLGDELGLELHLRLSGSVHVAAPEPSSALLAIVGAVGIAVVGYRRRQR